MANIDHVVRYVATYQPVQGLRTMMCAAQGRNTYATRAEAQAWLDAVIANNSEENLSLCFGAYPRFQVRECKCYPGHFAPMSAWFTEY